MPNPFWICDVRLGGILLGNGARAVCARANPAVTTTMQSCRKMYLCSILPAPMLMKLAVAGLTLTQAVWSADFRAGVARVDITPPVGHVMGGSSDRKQGATGTHDPLNATVLVIESGDTSLALVTCDLRSFVSTRVGELAKQNFGIKTTII